ncbi:toxin-activating lysine-acyltransferase [Bradyrhizobium sp. I1.7.5]|uniref:toxin-activating lysine-acyltransferase n=1 Tax=Bradyrhizobium sp. I1.7.5 TaxID=3156363 RepID=UPI003391742F
MSYVPTAVVPDKLIVLGELLYLMACSRVHQRYRIEEIGRLILPAINRMNFRVYRTKAGPVGLVTWARLDDEASAAFAAGGTLRVEEFDRGNNLWVLDFIAPFGHAAKILADLRDNVFRDATRVRAVRRDETGTVLRVVDLRRSVGNDSAHRSAHATLRDTPHL